MKEIVCWCCEHYRVYLKEGDMDLGICLLHNKELPTENRVCEDFILKFGVYTKREIPSYCKHYQKNKKDLGIP